jgi:hypothetical protein
VVLFDNQGNYKNVIDSNGYGPKEYLNISDAWFNNGCIELFSGHSRLIHRYTENGEHIETLKAKYDKTINGGEMIPYQNGYLAQQINPSGPVKIIPYDGFFTTDSQLNFTGKGAPIIEPNRAPFNTGQHLSRLGESVFYKKPLNGTVYQVIRGELHPMFKFEFGDDWALLDPKSNKSMQSAMRVALKSDKAVEFLPYVGSEYILLAYYINLKNEEKGYIDRKSGEFTRFDMRKKDKEKYELRFIEWENGRLLSSIAAYDFEEFMQNLKKDQFTIAGGVDLEEVFQSENPVLLKIKFK